MTYEIKQIIAPKGYLRVGINMSNFLLVVGKNEDGDPNASTHSGGGIGTNGIAFNLGGRTVAELKKPVYESQAQGTVVVTIRVNRYGKVVNATAGAKGSTTTNSYLYARAKEAALQTTFDAKLIVKRLRDWSKTVRGTRSV